MKIDQQILIEANNYLKERNLAGKIVFRGEVSHLVRAGRNQISLNISEESAHYFVTIQKGKKQSKGEFVLKEKKASELIEMIKQLETILNDSPEIDHLGELAEMTDEEIHDDHSDKEMHMLDTSIMIELYKKAVHDFKPKDCEVSGAFSLGTYSYSIINTKSEKPVSYKGSDYNVDVVLQLKNHNNKEIKASQVGNSLSMFNSDEIIKELHHHYNIKTNTHRTKIDLGKYDVIFGADALAELFAYTSWVGFSGETYLMQTGMFKKGTHDIGKKVFGDNITIVDDPESSTSLFNRRIGLNGLKRPKSTVINKGVLEKLFYSEKDICDRYDVKIDNDFSVSSLELMPGQGPSEWEELIKSVKGKAIYINTLHYMNFTNVAKGEFTATSRFGTYLIENGEIKVHLYNVRINDSFLRLFNNINWLSKKLAHVNLSSTYGMRLASSVSVPQWALAQATPITACFAPE